MHKEIINHGRNMRGAFVFDVDGTLSDVEHRVGFANNGDWKNFFAKMDADPVNADLRDVLLALHREGYQVIISSARPAEYLSVTVDWLQKHGIWDCADAIYLRDAGDFRKDSIVKKEFLDDMRLDPQIGRIKAIFDDRQQVVDMWRANGETCYQVAAPEPVAADKAGKLLMLIGPTGGGKSTYLDIFRKEEGGWSTIQTDVIRRDLTGDALDQSANGQVFKIAHDTINMHTRMGMNVVFEATNLRRKDRRAVIESAAGRVGFLLVNYDFPWVASWRDDVVKSGKNIRDYHKGVLRDNMRYINKGDDMRMVTQVYDYTGIHPANIPSPNTLFERI